jgi:hypothetical protein
MNPGYQNIRTIESFEWKCFPRDVPFSNYVPMTMRFDITGDKRV